MTAETCTIFVLLTTNTRNAMPEKMEVLESFGAETIVVGDNIRDTVRGEVTYMRGTQADFHQWIRDVGELWITTNPMFGNWQCVSPEVTA